MRVLTGTRLVLLSWLVLGAGDGLHVGAYSDVAVGLMLTATCLMALPLALPARLPLTRPSAHELALTLLAIGLTSPLTNKFAAGQDIAKSQTRAALLLAPLVAALLLLLPRLRAVAGPLVLAVAAGAGAVTISIDPRPEIDVWYLVQGAADSVLHGSNMFTDQYPQSPGITDDFPYLPGTGLLLAPFRLVTGDVRVGLLLLTFVGALAVVRLVRGALGWALAALVVLMPGWLFQVEFSWTEPMLLAPLALTVLLVLRGRLGWAVVAFAAALFAKQDMVLLVPVLACWPALGPRRAVGAFALAAAATLPWFLWDPGAFLDGTLLLHVHLEPRSDSLSVFTSFARHGAEPPYWVVGATAAAGVVTACLAVRRAPSAPVVVLGCAWALAVLNLVNKQTFYNEWWLVGGLLVLALAATRERSPARAL